MHIPNEALFTDLYQLTMLQAYMRAGQQEEAVFDLFVRRLRDRNYLIACGLDAALEYLEHLRFEHAALEYLSSLPEFDRDFIEWLERFRFSGDVYAVAEGTVLFADEPLLEVVAPLPQAQLVETALLNRLTYASNVATKASRVVTAAAGRPVSDFGMRRMQGSDATLIAARASYIAGVASTSNVLAGQVYGLKVTGTMAHSFVEVQPTEKEAFRLFSELYPGTTLLVDTFDTLEAIRQAAVLFHELAPNQRFGAIRLDSGDLARLAREAREILDREGLESVRILASGSLDEYAIADLVAAGAPIDGFGVGTRMGTVSDLPYLDTAYKLVEYGGAGRMKLSEDKANYPGRKQIFRRFKGHEPGGDVLAHADERLEGKPLLERVMQNGVRTAAGRRDLSDVRTHAAASVRNLPVRLRALENADPPYPVSVSERLSRATRDLAEKLGAA